MDINEEAILEIIRTRLSLDITHSYHYLEYATKESYTINLQLDGETISSVSLL